MNSGCPPRARFDEVRLGRWLPAAKAPSRQGAILAVARKLQAAVAVLELPDLLNADSAHSMASAR
jgi:hypothetical protein